MIKKILLIFIFIIACPAILLAQEKSKLIYVSEKISDEIIYIDYIVIGENTEYNLSVYLKKYRDASYNYKLQKVSGDMGAVQGTGSKRIIWNFLDEFRSGVDFDIYYFFIVDNNDPAFNTGLRTARPQKKTISVEDKPQTIPYESTSPSVKSSNSIYYWIGGGLLVAGGITYYLLSKKESTIEDNKLIASPPDRPR